MAATTAAVLAGAALVGTMYQANRQKKEAQKTADKQNEAMRLAAKKQQIKEQNQKTTDFARQQRQKQMAMLAAKANGRDSTILGGASGIAAAGNQAQSGAGKTLLGV